MKSFCFYSLILLMFIGCQRVLLAQGKTVNPPARKTIIKQERKPKMKFSNPKTMPKSAGYSHVVEVKSGSTIYLSGQVALDREGNIVGRNDFRAQCVQVFENLKAGLEAVGASFKDVAKINIYVTDVSQLQIFREVRDKYVDTENPPASSMVEVRKLVREEFLIEIDAVAMLPEN